MILLREFSRFAVGGLFLFSGLIKVNDPVGTKIKLEEYFAVFSADIAPFFEWFIPTVLFLSVLLSVLEVVLGTALIIGYRMKITSWVLLIIIIFFTFLTFYSAYFNKVTDCGCFGDAIKLTPWQSFYKDLILLLLILVIFNQREKYRSFLNPLIQEVKIGSVTLIMLFLALYAIAHLPFIDFRAYKIGSNIPKLMEYSEPLRYAYIMEKDGQTFEFEKYPTGQGYTYVEAKLLNPEAEPKISDFTVFSDSGEEFTEEVLHGKKVLLIFHDINKASSCNMEQIKNLTISQAGYKTVILTSSSLDSFEPYRRKHQLSAPVYNVDATVLKTMVRSNPGIILFNDGVVEGKWHFNDVPSLYEIEN